MFSHRHRHNCNCNTRSCNTHSPSDRPDSSSPRGRISPRVEWRRATFSILRAGATGAALLGAIAFFPGTASATLIDGQRLTAPPGRELPPPGWERNGGPAWLRSDRANPGRERRGVGNADVRAHHAGHAGAPERSGHAGAPEVLPRDTRSDVRQSARVFGAPDTMKPASAVPEPSSFLMFALALGVAALPGRVATFRRRDRRATRESARDRAPAQRAKRAIDVVGSIIGLTLSAPLVALSAIAIKLETPGPVFFGQTRCGKNGRTFKMWKLRSMVQNAEASQSTLQDDNAMDGPVFKIKGDPRITGVGRWLRRFSVDEVPQFWNVMRGEMSLVGPRPPLPSEVEQYGPRERRRLDVDPGLTCTWQVSGRNEIGFDEWMEIDLEYVENWTLTRDLVLIARTVPAIVNGRGSY